MPVSQRRREIEVETLEFNQANGLFDELMQGRMDG